MSYAEPPKGSLAPVLLASSTQPPSADFMSQLLTALGQTIRDRYYKSQTIHLDGYTFVNCCFHNCMLVTETGVFTLDGCTVSGCTVRFGNNAIRLIRLFNLLDGLSSNSIFNPEIAADGAVTIR